jgi:hypothetical protein
MAKMFLILGMQQIMENENILNKKSNIKIMCKSM